MAELPYVDSLRHLIDVNKAKAAPNASSSSAAAAPTTTIKGDKRKTISFDEEGEGEVHAGFQALREEENRKQKAMERIPIRSHC